MRMMTLQAKNALDKSPIFEQILNSKYLPEEWALKQRGCSFDVFSGGAFAGS